MMQGQAISKEVYTKRRTDLLHLQIKALHIYGLEIINDLGVNP